MCKPSFCCIYDAKENYLAQPCSTDENCAQYAYCYIIWFKLHDTIGPAIHLRMQYQNDDAFYNYQNDDVFSPIEEPLNDDFWSQVVFHHFNNVQEIIDAGMSEEGEFVPSLIFDDPKYWEGTPTTP